LCSSLLFLANANVYNTIANAIAYYFNDDDNNNGTNNIINGSDNNVYNNNNNNNNRTDSSTNTSTNTFIWLGMHRIQSLQSMRVVDNHRSAQLSLVFDRCRSRLLHQSQLDVSNQFNVITYFYFFTPLFL
jgi:hypothetical protein